MHAYLHTYISIHAVHCITLHFVTYVTWQSFIRTHTYIHTLHTFLHTYAHAVIHCNQLTHLPTFVLNLASCNLAAARVARITVTSTWQHAWQSHVCQHYRYQKQLWLWHRRCKWSFQTENRNSISVPLSTSQQNLMKEPFRYVWLFAFRLCLHPTLSLAVRAGVGIYKILCCITLFARPRKKYIKHQNDSEHSLMRRRGTQEHVLGCHQMLHAYNLQRFA